ncbi:MULTISPECIES: hypothetical protein [unclassified Aureimonas]|uniref:hypothetical protein n=1 Tax=unclassified Aureimonas TaxID=2615206 RepID=UPI0006F5E4FB|nr:MULTISPECIES: hypothetical protein [unclassified Aureimonas]KQT57469.1 hypothetical protein ASG62_09120 [Aureimonas sp. Leaf427]KQT77148.1 hypothetical protein ASG54_12985 [Aureimonas sp. Leaf460]
MTERPIPTSPNEAPSKPSDKRDADMPAAGPHANPALTDKERTPGAGTLPDPDQDDVGDSASS